MNRAAWYASHLKRASKLYGPFLHKSDAEAYAKARWPGKWAVYPMTGNDIVRTRAKVIAP